MSDSTSNTPVPFVDPSIFTEIPENIYVPGNYVQAIPSYDDAGLFAFPARILLVAQALPSGTALPRRIYPLTSPGQATNYCGAGSIGETQAYFLLAANPTVPVDIICVLDAAGSGKAAGAINIAGAWTQNGTLPLYLGGVQILVPVSATDTPATVAANAVALINAVANPSLPVVASAGTGTAAGSIILTSRHGCAEMNTFAIYVATGKADILPGAMTATVVPMTGGTVNQSIAGVISAIAGLWYTDIVTPWQDLANASALQAEMDNRYTATAKLDMGAFMCATGSYAQTATFLGTVDSRFRCTLPITNPQTPHWAVSASMCGVCAQIWFTDPSQQVKDIVLPGVVPPLPGDRFSWQQQNLLVPEGGCIYDVLKDGTMVIKRMVSENTTDNTGTPTTAWQDPMAARVETRIRYDWRTYLNLTYPDNKLADDGSLAAENNPNIATPNRVRGSWGARCTLYGQLGWIEDVQDQCRKAQFSRDPNSRNRLNEVLYYQRVGNLMVSATALYFEA